MGCAGSSRRGLCLGDQSLEIAEVGVLVRDDPVLGVGFDGELDDRQPTSSSEQSWGHDGARGAVLAAGSVFPKRTVGEWLAEHGASAVGRLAGRRDWREPAWSAGCERVVPFVVAVDVDDPCAANFALDAGGGGCVLFGPVVVDQCGVDRC